MVEHRRQPSRNATPTFSSTEPATPAGTARRRRQGAGRPSTPCRRDHRRSAEADEMAAVDGRLPSRLKSRHGQQNDGARARRRQAAKQVRPRQGTATTAESVKKPSRKGRRTAARAAAEQQRATRRHRHRSASRPAASARGARGEALCLRRRLAVRDDHQRGRNAPTDLLDSDVRQRSRSPALMTYTQLESMRIQAPPTAIWSTSRRYGQYRGGAPQRGAQGSPRRLTRK